jgi:tRNA (cmo5U34)-methyltransferase
MPDIADSFTTGGWEFTPEVTAVFDDHVRASVPYYDDIQQMVAEFSDWLLPDNSLFVDLGASTCTTLQTICERHPTRRFRAELYDEEPSMLHKAKDKVAGLNVSPTFNVQRLQQPFKHKDADLTVSLFTLQFLREPDRLAVLTEARRCAAPNGAIILAEKIRPEHPLLAEIAMDASHDFKAKCGLNDTAIRSKARALRGVLMPQPLPRLMAELFHAGWNNADVVFRWHQWVIVIGFAR